MLLMHGVVAFALAVGVQSDSAEVARVVDAFHSALTAGDSIAAFSLLTEDALILESGGLETLEEYRSRHLPGDIAFAQAVTRERRRVRIDVRGGGDVAWVVSTSITTGEFRGRQINLQGAELMVLVRTDQGGWRISAIHWSSRARKGQGG